MFNKKLLNVLAHIVAVMITVKLGLDLLVFVWAFFAVPTWASDTTINKILSVLTDVGSVMFLYLVIAALRSLAVTSEKPQKAPLLPSLLKKPVAKK